MKYPAFGAPPALLPTLIQPAVADRLDDAWFGPGSAKPMQRNFKIQPN